MFVVFKLEKTGKLCTEIYHKVSPHCEATLCGQAIIMRDQWFKVRPKNRRLCGNCKRVRG